MLGGRVECGQGFVEKEKAWTGGQGSREGDSLCLPPGQFAGLVIEQVGQAERGDPFALGGDAEVLRAEADVLADRHVRKQQVVLKQHSDASVLGWKKDRSRRLVDGGRIDADVAVVDGTQTSDSGEQRALAGAVRPEESHRLSRFAGEFRVDRDGADGGGDLRGQTHDLLPRKRPRREIRTVSDTASSTRLNASASSLLTSSAE